MKYFLVLISLAVSGLLVLPEYCLATSKDEPVRTVLNQETLEKGFTMRSGNEKLKVGVPPGSITPRKRVRAALKVYNKDDVNLEGERLVSRVYSYDFYNKNGVRIEDGKPIWLGIRYRKTVAGKKVIKFWNEVSQSWQEIPSDKKKNKKLVQGAMQVPYAQVAVFAKEVKKKKTTNNVDYQIGMASWYVHSGAASTKYPYGSIVKVRNLANGKWCKVKITDYGPFISGRVIDLPKGKFSEIADIGEGVVKVKVIPIYIP